MNECHFEFANSIAASAPLIAAKIYLDANREHSAYRELICHEAYRHTSENAAGPRWGAGFLALAELGDFEKLGRAISEIDRFHPAHRISLAVVAADMTRAQEIDSPENRASDIAPFLIKALQQKSAGRELVILATATWDTQKPALSESYLEAAVAIGFENHILETGCRLIQTTEDLSMKAFGAACVRKAAHAGLPMACSVYGFLLRDGIGLRSDEREASNWLRKSAEAGDAFGMVVLADLLLDSPRIQQKAGEPEFWLNKARESGEKKAEATLKAWEEKIAEHREASEQGDTDDMESLANELFGLPSFARNTGEAESWLRIAAVENENAKANLAIRLLDGNGVAQNATQGERLLREAAASSNCGMVALIQRLREGRGLAPDVAESDRFSLEMAKKLCGARGELADPQS